MNPVEIGTGKSFKGLAAYLLHDPGRAETAERVGWAQSYNLDDADPDRAWRLMAATAMSADQLKEAAGIKKGKAAKNTAWHFAITFDPKDTVTEDVQRAAVASSLKALGLDKHQALAVMHDDTDHKHIHVMVNLIDPATGISAASKQPGGRPALLSNTQRKFSQWAARFEREHGLIVNEGRLSNANKRAQGEEVDARRLPRNKYEEQKLETTDRRRDFMRRDFDARAQELGLQGHNMREAQRLEWDALKLGYKAEKAATWQTQRDEEKQAVAEVKASYKDQWRARFMRQRSELHDFERGERSAIGRIWHGAAVIREGAKSGDLLAAFVAAFSQDERRNIISRRHARENERLGKEVRKAIMLRLRGMRREQKQTRDDRTLAYLKECNALKQTHEEQRGELRELWRQHNIARKRALAKDRPIDLTIKRGKDMQRGRGLEPS